jgi:hypothetical protein
MKMFGVTIKVIREHTATITVKARDQDEADRIALDLFDKQVFTGDGGELGLPGWWTEHEPSLSDAEIDTKFRCIDCGKNTQGGEYYMVYNEIWAASGVAPHGGMLCLACLERRIGRPLTMGDFTSIVPSLECWERHIAQRDRPLPEAVPLSLLDERAE